MPTAVLSEFIAIGRYDEIGSSDCPGPYDVYVVSVPRSKSQLFRPELPFTPDDVRRHSEAVRYGTYDDYRHAFDVLAIFSDKRLSPADGRPVDTCAKLPFAVCRTTNKAFNLVDAAVNFGVDELEGQVARWLSGSFRRLALLRSYRLTEEMKKRKKLAIPGPLADAIDVDRLEPDDLNTELPRGDSGGSYLDEEDPEELEEFDGH